jgi:hypothetical protein
MSRETSHERRLRVVPVKAKQTDAQGGQIRWRVRGSEVDGFVEEGWLLDYRAGRELSRYGGSAQAPSG